MKLSSSTSVSSRALRFLRPTLPYIVKQIEAYSNLYHQTDNPDGSIPLSIAENNLSNEILLEQINNTHDYPSTVLNYQDPTGVPALKKAICNFMTRHIFGGHECQITNIICGPGVSSLLHHLSLLLFEAGDSVLIPAPYYPAFVKDFSNLGTVVAYDIIHPASNDSSWLIDCWDKESLNNAYQRAVDKGNMPKAVLLTNPNNPSGVISSREKLLELIDWCRSMHIHLIADEIYALSVFDDDRKFVSVVELLENNLGDHVHILWGLSKDFGASGLRLGVIYSQNETLLRAMSYITDAFQVSTLVQLQAAAFLSNEAFLDNYITENKKRLRVSYQILKAGLEATGTIKLVEPSGAGIFALLDCRQLLWESSFPAERELTNWFIDRGVILTPGEACHCPVPGYFRICFAWVQPDALREAVKRMGEVTDRARKEKIERRGASINSNSSSGSISSDTFPIPTKRPRGLSK